MQQVKFGLVRGANLGSANLGSSLRLTFKNVLPYEVEEFLSGKCKIYKKEKGKVEGEHLYNALGRTGAGRYLSVFFIKKLNNKALIVTARGMNRNERKRYGRK